MMKNRLKVFNPADNLKKYIDSYWFFRNNTIEIIKFPVVPDGCSDIVFYLNNSNKLNDLENTFVTGVMESAELVSISNKMELFGVRFRPGVLSYLLKTDMRELKNKMCNLSKIKMMNFKIGTLPAKSPGIPFDDDMQDQIFSISFHIRHLHRRAGR